MMDIILAALLTTTVETTVQLKLEDAGDTSERLRPCFYKPPCVPGDYAASPPEEFPRHHTPPPRVTPRAEPWYGPPLAPRLEPYRSPPLADDDRRRQ